MVGGNKGKKTLGRRKIEIKKIKSKVSLAVTFTKRRTGLFNKASELSLLSGARIAVLVQSPAGKVYSFGEDALIHPFLTGEAPPPLTADYRQMIMARRAYDEAVMKLEIEKRGMGMGPHWWNGPYEGLELHELEGYLEALKGLADNVSKRAEEKETEELMKLYDDDFTDTNFSEILGEKEMGMEELMANFGSVPLHQDFSASSSASTSSYDGPVDDYDLFEFINLN